MDNSGARIIAAAVATAVQERERVLRARGINPFLSAVALDEDLDPPTFTVEGPDGRRWVVMVSEAAPGLN
jgi:hypothetical protein